MIRRPLLPALLCLAALAAPLAAFDFGVSVDNSTTGNQLFTGGVNLTQTDKVSLWLLQNFDANTSISLKGNYKFSAAKLLSPEFNPANHITNIGDLDSLVFFLGVPGFAGTGSKLSLWAGRTAFADFSGDIINHKLDGVSAELAFPGFSWKLGVATSAGLLKHSNGLFVANQDLADMGEWSKVLSGATAPTAANVLATPRLFLLSSLSFPQVVPGFNVDAGIAGQVDLSQNVVAAESKVSAKTAANRLPVHSGYVGLGLGGKITSTIYWSASGWLQLGYTLYGTGTDAAAVFKPALVVSNTDSLRMTMFIPELGNSVLDLGGKIGLGDPNLLTVFPDSGKPAANGFITGFSPMSFRGAGIVFAPQLGNLIQADLGYSAKPFGNALDLQTELRGFMFMRLLPNAPIMEPSHPLTNNTTENYLGTEIDLNLSLRLLSDLGMSLGFGAFLPNVNVIKTSQPYEFKAKFDLSLSL